MGVAGWGSRAGGPGLGSRGRAEVPRLQVPGAPGWDRSPGSASPMPPPPSCLPVAPPGRGHLGGGGRGGRRYLRGRRGPGPGPPCGRAGGCCRRCWRWGRGGAAGGGAPRGPGEPCGVYTPGCARGLRCSPRPGERAPLRALLRGTGLCRPPRPPPATAGPAGDSPQEGAPATPPPGPPPADGTEELDTAPCRGHLAAVLQELRAGLFRSAAALFLPNCDTRGFYRPKQCRASQGPKRWGSAGAWTGGGTPLAGTEGQGGAPRCPPT
ncbi:insulin-like growth factor-binding protein 6 [Falco cherrug]|uniref:insulin-like growth factor-binding protein 6 n=1 Tax=Falco cherrug TaxID=345164 RepID=UPI00247AB5EE|nr:insulin-like growth factor-binding protein 6 [Falco cherrug]